ncbi:MAG TPA: TIM barrel protein [Devosia sp.]|nr:TIM barrel protein [Devosia sp.]
MIGFSACIEWLFAAEAPDFPDRIRAAKSAGLAGVEFWGASGKDLDATRAALDETGLPLLGTLVEPMRQITDPEMHDAWLAGLETSLAAALKLGSRAMIVTTGDERHDTSRPLQHAALVKVLSAAAGIVRGSGVTLMLEPLNDRVDHVGYYLTSTSEGLDIVDEVDRPEVKLVYDIYHSAMMGEATETVLEGRLDRVAHVHLADTQGRHEPGSGTMDWQARLDWLFSNGYQGLVGLEYRPTGPTLDSLKFREML